MVLSGEWSQVEVIDLVNDGNGLGFILVGGRSTGVVVKALTPGGIAERDGRLQNGDHLIQIGEVNLRGYSSEQVAMVLRQAGKQVRLIVARPIETSGSSSTTTGDMKILSLTNRTLIISTKQLSDPEELAKFLFPQVNFTTTTTTTTTITTTVAVATTMKTENNKNLEQGGLLKTTGSAQPLTTLPVEHNHKIDLTNFILKSDNELADLPLPELPQKFLDSNEISYDADLDIVPYSIISPPCIITPTSPTTVDIPLIKTDHHFSKDHIKTVIARHLCAGNQAKFLMETANENRKDDDNDDNDNDDDGDDDDDDQEVSPGFSHLESPETETYEVRLRKNVYGLGITVAGYVCEEEDVSGIFVKSIIEGSAAEMSGKIQANDRIIAVDGILLTGVTNHQAVEILRNTDIEVRLTLERFLRGRKFEHLQIALTGLKVDAHTHSHSQSAIPPSISLTTLSWLSPKLDTATDLIADESIANCSLDDTDMTKEDEEVDRIVNNYYVKQLQTKHEMRADEGSNLDEKIESPKKKFQSDLSHLSPAKFQSQYELSNDKQHLNSNATVRTSVEEENNEESKSQSIDKTTQHSEHSQHTQHTQQTQHSSMSMESLKVAWKSEFPESQVIVVEINKLSGLGISLEGTVDVEYGIEKRPHHYIRSILEDGPVGKQGILKPGDELLQVNEHNLQGLNHTEVVKILKELPPHVKLVCVRGTMSPSIINTSNNPEAFETRSLLPGGHQSLQNLVTKAQSESSLYTSSTATLTDRQKSKSLENISGLALWSNEITYVEIEKLEQGFGFSILDYQDPLDPDGNVIVIRGLIHGGSAETTNQIFPGDRLVSVGEHDLQGLTLDEAVTILKGMPLGVTKLGICRPFSASDSNIDSGSGENDLTSA